MAASLTKEQLRNELISHGVQPPATSARKEEFIKLYEQHVAPIASQKGDFSSDEENDAADVEVKVSPPSNESLNLEGINIATLSDEELFEQLQSHGIPVGPIVDSTRAVYQRKLLAVLNKGVETSAPEQTNGNGNSNGKEEERFSDSEEEVVEKVEEEAVEEDEVEILPEIAQEPVAVAAPVITSPEPLTSIRKRITGDSRPPSSLSALPLVDRQGTPTPRPSIRSVTSTGSYTFESRRLLDSIDGSTVQPLASKPSTSPKPKRMRYVGLVIVVLLAVAFITYTYADVSQLKLALESVQEKVSQYLTSPKLEEEVSPSPAPESHPVQPDA